MFAEGGKSVKYRGFKLGVVLMVLVGFLTAGLQPASAISQLEKFRKEQQAIQSKMEAQKKALRVKEQQKKTYLSQLEVLEDNIRDVQGDLTTLDGQLKNAKVRVAMTTKELQEKEKALDLRNTAFQDRLRDVYINGQTSYLEVVFQATDISDLLVRFDLMSKLVGQDVDLMNEIKVERQAVISKKQELEAKQQEIVEIKANTEQKELNLAQSSANKKQLIETVEAQKTELAKALDEMESLSKQVGEKIRKIQLEQAKNSKNHFSGRFAWPTPGYTRVTSDYGMRMHPILHQRRMHTGIDIAAPSGTAIKAVDKGTVIYTGALGAYGNVVIIDHGDGISSMYAHQSRIQARENQNVAKGQVIGRVGSTGWSTGAHLHFEVRKNGNPINPWSYLK